MSEEEGHKLCADKADGLWEMSATSAQNGKDLGNSTCLSYRSTSFGLYMFAKATQVS